MESTGAGTANPRIKAGYTFLGQFIDHDLTLDAVSILEQQIDVAATTNFRTPAFELDSLYGRGPGANPAMYDDGDGRFLVERNNTDLPRNAKGTAIIGDHRNDENRIVGQLHTLFLKFHNKVLDDIVRDGAIGDAANAFEAAQKIVRWHYQWIVLHEFLPRTVGQELVDALLSGIDRNHVGPAFMPVEFSGAAYRFGHSQVRGAYELNQQFPGGAGGFAPIFPADPAAPLPAPGPKPAQVDLRGGGPLPDYLVIDWGRFFGANAQESRAIDTKIQQPLLKLPNGVVPPGSTDPMRSLAVRNLLRGFDLRLPAGQTIADFLGIARLPEASVWKDVTNGKGLAPLWFYVLREAEVLHQGQHLGGVGAVVVAKTFINLLLSDKASFLWQHPGWKPHLPVVDPDKANPQRPAKFTMVDLINYTLGTTVANETSSFASMGAANIPTENVTAQRD